MDGRDLAIDRISDLPDPLLAQILSLLTTKEAIHTCLLSKRWVDLWTYVDTLDFDYRISGFDREDKFLQFIHGVLNRRGFSPLDKFKLSWQYKIRSDHGIGKECINHAVACMPRVIYILTHDHMFDFNLPDSLFNCGSVTEMSLLSNHTVWRSQPKSINLPSLKKLELGCLSIKDGYIRMLLMGCPVLEELILMNCFLLMINEINSSVLKNLTMKKCLFPFGLKSLNLKNASSLATADLEISYAAAELNLLDGLPNVTSLRLYTTSHHVLELLDKDIPNCRILNNLRSLELGELPTRYGWNLVDCFLQHSPNLKKLVLNFRHSGVIRQEALPGKNSFRREFLQIVQIRVTHNKNCVCKDESEKTVSEVVTTLGALVKTIRKIVILLSLLIILQIIWQVWKLFLFDESVTGCSVFSYLSVLLLFKLDCIKENLVFL